MGDLARRLPEGVVRGSKDDSLGTDTCSTGGQAAAVRGASEGHDLAARGRWPIWQTHWKARGVIDPNLAGGGQLHVGMTLGYVGRQIAGLQICEA